MYSFEHARRRAYSRVVDRNSEYERHDRKVLTRFRPVQLPQETAEGEGRKLLQREGSKATRGGMYLSLW